MKLKPIILESILKLSLNRNEITAAMVRDYCLVIEPKIVWGQRLPAICNSMRSLIGKGFDLISENKDSINFTLKKNNSYKSENTSHSFSLTTIKENNSFEKLDMTKKNILINCSSKKLEEDKLKDFEFSFDNLSFHDLIGEYRIKLYKSLINAEKHIRFIKNKKVKIEQNINLNKTEKAYLIYSKGKVLNSAISLKWVDNQIEKTYILSALFGIIKASDYIPLYDLAINDKIDNLKICNFWRDSGAIDTVLENLSQENIQLINLLSNEYKNVINNKHSNLINLNIHWNDRGDQKGKWIKFQFDK
jgi:cytoplasmic iron level regulating protein YaaA (DUF328/UPF0246 family)